jgi:Pentapeptide repeats (8 copies)
VGRNTEPTQCFFSLLSDFTSSQLISSHLISAQLISAQLISAQLSSAQLSSAQLSSAQLSSAQLYSRLQGTVQRTIHSYEITMYNCPLVSAAGGSFRHSRCISLLGDPNLIVLCIIVEINAIVIVIVIKFLACCSHG